MYNLSAPLFNFIPQNDTLICTQEIKMLEFIAWLGCFGIFWFFLGIIVTGIKVAAAILIAMIILNLFGVLK